MDSAAQKAYSATTIIEQLQGLDHAAVPLHSSCLNAEQYEDYKADLSRQARLLANAVYDYVNVQRIIDLKAYVALIRSHTDSFRTEAFNLIIEQTEQIFLEEYSRKLKDRGESPKLRAQILKRTGKEQAPQLSFFLSDKRPVKLCEQLVFTRYSKDQKSLKSVNDEIDRYSDAQKRELAVLLENFNFYQQAEVVFKTLRGKENIILLYLVYRRGDFSAINSQLKDYFINEPGQDNIDFSQWIILQNYPPEYEQQLQYLCFGMRQQVSTDAIFEKVDQHWEHFTEYYYSTENIEYLDTEETCFNRTDYELLAYPFLAAEFSLASPAEITAAELVAENSLNFLLDQNLFSVRQKIEKSHWQTKQIKSGARICSLIDYLRTNLFCSDEQVVVPEHTTEFRRLFGTVFPLFRLPGEQLEKLVVSYGFSGFADYIDSLLARIGPKEASSFLLMQLVCCQENSKIDLERLKTSASDSNSATLSQVKSLLEEGKAQELTDHLETCSASELADLPFSYVQNYGQNFYKLVEQLPHSYEKIILEERLAGFDFLATGPDQLLALSPVQIHLYETEQSVLSAESKPEGFTQTVAVCYEPASILLSEIYDQSDNGLQIYNRFNELTGSDHSPENLEFAFNLLFSFWERSQEYSAGVFRNCFQRIRNEEKISSALLDQIVALTEGFPEDLLNRLYQIIRDPQKADLAKLKLLKEIFREYKIYLPIIKKLYKQLTAGKSMRDEIHQFSLLVRDENLGMLMLDGFDPEILAQKIRLEIQEQFRSARDRESYSARVFELLKPKEKFVIPTNQNWLQEMYHQVRIRYADQFGKKLLSDLIATGIDGEDDSNSKELAVLLYGSLARRTHALHKVLMHSDQKKVNELIGRYLNYYKPAELERISDLYQAYYLKDLQKDLITKSDDPQLRKRIEQQFSLAMNWEQEKLNNKITD